VNRPIRATRLPYALMSSSDAQYAILSRLATDETWRLVEGRLLKGERFFHKRGLKPGYSRDQVKLALLLVRVGNPVETLTSEELRLLE